MKVYLDDLRNPKHQGWTVVRSYDEAVALCEKHGCPATWSFDHDLGNNAPTGYDFVKWLIDTDLDNPGFIPDTFSFNVHSANPVGAVNISNALSRYLSWRSNK